MNLPSEKVTEHRRKLTRLTNMVGADLETPRLYNPRLMLIIAIGVISITVLQINGFYKAWPNILNICQALFFIPLIIQIFSKIINRFIVDDEAINRELQVRLVNFNKSHETNLIYRMILVKKLDTYSNFSNMIIILYFIMIHTPFVGMFVSAVHTGTYQLVAPIYLPYVDPSKLYGFIINTVIQLILTEFTFITLVAQDSQFMFIGYQIALMLDILTMKFKELGHILSNQKLGSQKTFKSLVRKNLMDVKKIPEGTDKVRLINLIKDYYEITEFTSLLFKEMKIPVFFTLTTGSIALCLSTLTMLSYSEVIGAQGVFFYLGQVATLCSLVTFVVFQYEKFLDEIYRFPWYLLSKSEQKIFLQFIQFCQSYDHFELPMIGNVDMELFTSVVNTGYSYFMFIWNFVEITNNFLN